MNSAIKEIDNYIIQQPENVRGILAELRQTIKKAVPEAEDSPHAINTHVPCAV